MDTIDGDASTQIGNDASWGAVTDDASLKKYTRADYFKDALLQ